MAEVDEVEWSIEEIPDADSLFLRVHNNDIEGNDVKLAAFRAHGDGLSTDWSRYATPEWTRENAGPNPKTGKLRPAGNYGIVFFVVGPVRAVPNVSVQHKAISTNPKNRAHTDIEYSEGDKEQVRVELGRLWKWSIKRDA